MAHNRLHLYVPDDTLAILDRNRGPAARSAYVAHLILNDPADSDRRGGPDATPQPAPRPRKPVTTVETPLSDHQHTWKRQSQYLDACECGVDRAHQAGTR